ncbi:MAG: PEP-utilizing enzyme, partial [Anaerolineae bacterium]
GQGLRGIPTSRGHYTGPARVLRGIQDFARLQEGDVLVIPYSDVGWTPLFTKAGAVIAESGGILSHSSIIAREYGIPAVVSVPGACQIPDGTPVTVDGYRGEILVQEGTKERI